MASDMLDFVLERLERRATRPQGVPPGVDPARIPSLSVGGNLETTTTGAKGAAASTIIPALSHSAAEIASAERPGTSAAMNMSPTATCSYDGRRGAC